MAQYSGGLVRRINIIADKVLLSAFAESTHDLTARHVVAAVNDSAFGDDQVRKNSNLMWWLALPILFALALTIYKSEPLWAGMLAKFGAETVDMVEKQPQGVGKPTEIVRQVTENGDNREDTGTLVTKIAHEEAVVIDKKMATMEVNDAGTVTAAIKSDLAAPTQKTEAVDVTSNQVDDTADLQSNLAQMEVVDSNPQADTVTIEAIERTPESAVDQAANDTTPVYLQWLNAKLQQSREWLSKAPRNNISIQVMMSRKSSERKLVDYLQNEWPLSIDETYLYEVNMDSETIYRVFYREFESISQGREEMQRLPESVKANSPYLHSIYRMQKALL